MVDPITLRRFTFRILFLLLAILTLFLKILPLDLSAGRWPGPDFLVVLAFAWVLRRPNYVPVLMVATVMLVADMIFMRPPGLWAAITILGLEFLRSREQLSRDLPFPIEWAMVSAVLVSMTAAYQLILLVFIIQQPSFGLSTIQLITTILAYPLVVLASRYFLGVRKIAPGEVDQLGHRI